MGATPVPKGYNQNYSGVKVFIHHWKQGEKCPAPVRLCFSHLKRKSGGPKVARWWVIFRISRPHCWKQLAEPWIPYANRLYSPVWLIYAQLLAVFWRSVAGFSFLSPCTSCRAVTALKLGALAPDDTRAKLYVAVQPSKCYDFEHQTLDNLYGLIYCEWIHLIWKSVV